MKKHTQSDWVSDTAAEEMDSIGAMNIIRVGAGLVNQIIGLQDKTLCIGCGEGVELSFFSGSTKGIDLNDASLAKAKDAGYDVEKMDMHNLSFQDDSFDLVFSRDNFEHSVSHIQVISEMARVSKRYVAIVLPTEDWQSSHWHYIIPNLRQMISLGEKVGLQLKSLREYNIIVGSIAIGQSLYIFEKHNG